VTARHVLPAAGVAGLVVALLLGGTLALWVTGTTAGGGQVTAGDLDLTSGTTTWRQTTPGVTETRSGIVDGTVPADFFTMPGDVIEVVQPVSATLRGDNIEAGLTVRFADPSTVAPDVAAGRIAVGFAVLDATGTQVAPATGSAALGDTVAVPGLTGDAAGITTDWTVVIRVDVRGEYVWTDGAPIAAAGLWSAGDVLVELRQVRTGGAG
jgi:alternate signal-mediated exported protein